MPRPTNTAERRAQIVRGLAHVLAERGYERASVQSIAAAAGLASGLIHYHFGSKQEILVALAAELAEAVRRRVVAAPERARARDRLFAALDAYVARGEGADPEAVACWAAIGAEAARIPEVQTVYRAAMAESLRGLEDRVRDALREEGRSTRRARPIAAGLLAAIEGAFRIAAAAPDLLPAGFAAPTLRGMAGGLLDAEPAA
jgi:TetR/AcrR family transcriptional repressor of bet genes